MPRVFQRLPMLAPLTLAICTFVAGFAPASRADNGSAQAVMNLFGTVLNQMQQQQGQQSSTQPQSQHPNIEWATPQQKQPVISDVDRDQTTKVQAALKTLGFYTKTIDGLPGPATTAAIEAWQKQVGQEPDGILTSDEWEMLSLAAVKRQSAGTVLSETPPATPKQEPNGSATKPMVPTDPQQNDRRQLTLQFGPDVEQVPLSKALSCINQNPRVHAELNGNTIHLNFKDGKTATFDLAEGSADNYIITGAETPLGTENNPRKLSIGFAVLMGCEPYRPCACMQ